MANTKTCEFVSPRHPDKLCDYLADVLLDAFLELDPKSRVAIEIMGGHDSVSVSGEVTSKARLNIENIIKKIIGEKYSVKVYVAQQSPFISQGVDNGGAGDQGIMIGYATSETNNFMPLEYELARKLCNKLYSQFPYDGKTQVTIQDGEVKTVVASFQKTKTAELKKIVCGLIKAEEYLINPAGEWEMGGFDADSGLSGRKIMIDNYGPEIGVGGGSFSGKDWTKVDRSGAYMARRIAIDLLKEYGARTVRTKLAYAIGKKDPVMAVAEIDGKEEKITGYDLSSRGIYEFLNLGKIKFQKTAAWGHFGREFPWG
jgi:S-adenosylmethionine synthetase